ncbi:hypothetical protein F5Y14DRAFT_395574 [Nemania sp. NC0429]|nr:hypothetical protein F5Y14DRAFT_395574 [Nemania sp. NC0429]
MEEERATTPLSAAHDAISQPDTAASTTASAAIAQLPEITTMEAGATSPPQLSLTNRTASPTNTPPPPTAQTSAQEPHLQEQAPPVTTTTNTDTTAPAPSMASGSPPPQFVTYTQPATGDATTTATVTAAHAPIPAPAPPPMPTPMPPPMQMPMAAPIPVTINNHIASSPAAHAPTPSGNLVRRLCSSVCPLLSLAYPTYIYISLCCFFAFNHIPSKLHYYSSPTGLLQYL